MNEKQKSSSLIQYVLVVVLGAVFAGLVMNYSKARSAPADQVQEFAPGVKRWAGTWKTLGQPVPSATAVSTPDVTLEVDVQMFSFNPPEIKVKKGQVVRLKLHGKDDGQLPALTGTGSSGFTGHGFHIVGPYDVWVTGLRKGTDKEVTFVASTPGEFEMECVVLCGVNHPMMRGKFIVEE